MRSRLAAILVSLPALAALSNPAAAQVQATAAAKALYDRAVKEMSGGDYDAACPKLEEAVKLEPEALGAKLTLAECYERQGRLATAWATYLQVEGAAAKLTNQDARRKRAHESAEALRPRLAEVVVEVRDDIADLDGLHIRLDDLPLGRALWGVPLPVDRGDHMIEASAKGKKPSKKAFEIMKDGERVVVPLSALRNKAEKPRPLPALSTMAMSPQDGLVVKLESTDSDLPIALYRIDAGREHHLCDAPCNDTIETHGQRFFVGGKGVTPSRAFLLDDRMGKVVIVANPGKTSTSIAGQGMLVFGGVGIGVGAVLLGVGAASKGDATLTTTGLATLTIGAIITAIGIPVLLAGRTTVRSTAGMTPNR